MIGVFKRVERESGTPAPPQEVPEWWPKGWPLEAPPGFAIPEPAGRLLFRRKREQWIATAPEEVPDWWPEGWPLEAPPGFAIREQSGKLFRRRERDDEPGARTPKR